MQWNEIFLVQFFLLYFLILQNLIYYRQIIRCCADIHLANAWWCWNGRAHIGFNAYVGFNNKLRSHKKLNYADLKHKSHWTITQAALRPHFVNWTMANDVFFLNFYFLHSFCILIRTIKLKTDWRRLPSKLRLQSIYSIAFIILKSQTKKSKRKNGSVTRRSCTMI